MQAPVAFRPIWTRTGPCPCPAMRPFCTRTPANCTTARAATLKRVFRPAAIPAHRGLRSGAQRHVRDEPGGLEPSAVLPEHAGGPHGKPRGAASSYRFAGGDSFIGPNADLTTSLLGKTSIPTATNAPWSWISSGTARPRKRPTIILSSMITDTIQAGAGRWPITTAKMPGPALGQQKHQQLVLPCAVQCR